MKYLIKYHDGTEISSDGTHERFLIKSAIVWRVNRDNSQERIGHYDSQGNFYRYQ